MSLLYTLARQQRFGLWFPSASGSYGVRCGIFPVLECAPGPGSCRDRPALPRLPARQGESAAWNKLNGKKRAKLHSGKSKEMDFWFRVE